MGTLTVRSTAFDHGDKLPDRFTRNADNFSPPLTWKRAGPGRHLAIVAIGTDPGGGESVHWLVYGYFSFLDGLSENQALDPVHLGHNTSGGVGWWGPYLHRKLATLTFEVHSYSHAFESSTPPGWYEVKRHIEADPYAKIGSLSVVYDG